MQGDYFKNWESLKPGRVPAYTKNPKAKNGKVVREENNLAWEAGTLPTELHPQRVKLF
jgi:hypothetical protein